MPETSLASNPPLAMRLEALRQQLAGMQQEDAVNFFQPKNYNRLLKTTISLCADCLGHVPALVFTREGKVFLRKVCDRHGFAEVVLENDESFYHLSNKDRWGRCFATDRVMDFLKSSNGCDCEGGCSAPDEMDFADQTGNKSCTILVEVTNACNLACPVCYSDARGDRKMPLEAFKQHILRLIERKGTLDSVQLTGGEAVLHPEFWDMVAFLHGDRVKKIYLPTNGIAFANREIAERLAPFQDKIMVLLQFDGQETESNRAMRDANTTHVRDQVLENLGRLGIHTQLTMTITLGVNDHEIGWVVETGMRQGNVKVVALQPVTYSGRYQLSQDPLRRMTLSDCVKAVVAQVRQRSKVEDFKPIPCSHPNCGWITLFVQRFGLTANIARHINLEQIMGQVSNRTLLSSGELRSVIGTKPNNFLSRAGLWAGRNLVRSKDVFAIAIKPFMDRYNYDQDRISACCHHLLDTKGNPVSFCEYNARLRPGDLWDSFPLLKPHASATA